MRSSLLSIVSCFSFLLLLPSCEYPEEQYYGEPGSIDYIGAYAEVNLGSSETHVQKVSRHILAEEIAPSAIAYQEDPDVPYALRANVANQNMDMIDAGFNDFSRAMVYETRVVTTNFYSVYASTYSAPGKRDLCMVFIDSDTTSNTTDPSPNPDPKDNTIIEGPAAVGMGMSIEHCSNYFSPEQLERVFVPVERLKEGWGNFQDGMSEESFLTETGKMSIRYHREYYSNHGVIRLTAKGEIEYPVEKMPYELDYTWRLDLER